MDDDRPVKIRRRLLRFVYCTLEALWDCTCDPHGAGEDTCQRCRTLNEIREVIG